MINDSFASFFLYCIIHDSFVMYIHDLFLQIFTDLDTELPVRKSQICLEAKPGGVSV